jgi:hypothetical protein
MKRLLKITWIAETRITFPLIIFFHSAKFDLLMIATEPLKLLWKIIITKKTTSENLVTILIDSAMVVVGKEELQV